MLENLLSLILKGLWDFNDKYHLSTLVNLNASLISLVRYAFSEIGILTRSRRVLGSFIHPLTYFIPIKLFLLVLFTFGDLVAVFTAIMHLRSSHLRISLANFPYGN